MFLFTVINEEVSQQVYLAVAYYLTALEHTQKGQIEEAFSRSQTSIISAEKAFFDDTLLALLYFPEDQKYAIYIPLFLPVFISFAGSFLPFLGVFFKKNNWSINYCFLNLLWLYYLNMYYVPSLKKKKKCVETKRQSQLLLWLDFLSELLKHFRFIEAFHDLLFLYY